MIAAHFSRLRPPRLVMSQKLILAGCDGQIFARAWLFRHIFSLLAQPGLKRLETDWLVAVMQSLIEWNASLLMTLLSIVVPLRKARIVLHVAVVRLRINVYVLSFALLTLLVNYGLREVHLIIVFLVGEHGAFKGKRVLVLLFSRIN